MLAAMFAERDSCSPNIPLSVDSQGAYFIDYDGSRFGDILNFLRDDGSFLAPVDPGERQKLYQAACYFQVIGLMQVVHPCPSFTDKLVTSAQTTATAISIRTLATVGAFGFRFVIFGLIMPLD